MCSSASVFEGECVQVRSVFESKASVFGSSVGVFESSASVFKLSASAFDGVQV